MRWGDLMISAEGHKRSSMLTAVSGEFSQPKIQPRGFAQFVARVGAASTAPGGPGDGDSRRPAALSASDNRRSDVQVHMIPCKRLSFYFHAKADHPPCCSTQDVIKLRRAWLGISITGSPSG